MKDVFVIDYGVAIRYVFHGDNQIDKQQLNETLFHIDGKNVESVIYIPETIQHDDTIRTVKHKIFKYCNLKDTSIDEIYITSYEMRNITSHDILKMLDDVGDEGLEIVNLLQKNFKDERISENQITSATVESIESLLGKDETFLVEKSITTTYTKKLEDLVAANPLFVTETTIKHTMDMEQVNKNMDLKTLIDANIHNYNSGSEEGLYKLNLHLAKDIFLYFHDNGLSTDYLSNMYFPGLNGRDIKDSDTLESNTANLIVESQDEIEKVFNPEETVLKLVAMAHNNVDNVKISITKQGITSLRVKISPSGVFRVSLENIFKLLETTPDYSLVRLNYGRGQDKLYRLYSNAKTIQDEKIPYIGKSIINKVKKLPGRANTITIYCEEQVHGSTVPVYIDIDTECNLMITINADNTLSIKQVEEVIKSKTNYIVDKISSYLNNNGFYLSRFSGLTNSNTLDGTHETTFNIVSRKLISFKKVRKCLAPLFYVVKDDITKELLLIYKRVGNFNVMSDTIIEYYVTELLKQDAKDSMILGFLTENFNITIDIARETLVRIKNAIKLQDELMTSRVKAYTGIFVAVRKVPSSQRLLVTVRGLKNVAYVDYIQYYLKGLLELILNDDAYKRNLATIMDIDTVFKQKIINEAGYESGEDLKDSGNVGDIHDEDDDFDLSHFDLGEDEEDEIQDDNTTPVEIVPEEESDDDDADIVLDGGALPSKTDEPLFDLDDFLLEDEPTSLDTAQPVEDEPVEDEPVEDEPVEDEPVQDEPVQDEPVQDEPVKEDEIDESDLFNLSSVPVEKQTPSTDSDDARIEPPNLATDVGEELLALREETPLETINMDTVLPVESKQPEEKPKAKRGRKKKEDTAKKIKDMATDAGKIALESHPVIEKTTLTKLSDKDNLIEKEDLIGTKLNVLSRKLTDTDPLLFVSEKDKQFDSYSRMCASNQKRQPIVLTDDEKKRIDKLNPGSYDGAVYYGTRQDNKNWYICPRYWCLLNNMPLTKEQVDAGECGGKVIPHNAKIVPNDSFIYEFYNKTVHDNKGQYVQHYPGYLEPSKHRYGYCAPCCFKGVTNPAIKKRLEQCELEQQERDNAAAGLKDPDSPAGPKEKPEKQPSKKKIKQNDGDEPLLKKDVLAAEKLPLPNNRFGFFPIEFEEFLDIKHSDYFKKNTNIIKPNKKHFLRVGANNQSKNQSFLQAILWIYNMLAKENLSLTEFKEYICETVTLDKFLTFQNGNLYQYFNKRDAILSLVDLKKYKSTLLYTSLSKTNIEYLKRIVYSYEAFKFYLMEDNNLVDYRILWDIITNLNGIFNSKKTGLKIGVNLVIFEIVNNDATSNISFICPSNQYSSGKYNSKKKTIMLLCNEGFYEPIVFYNDTKAKDNSIEVTATFQEKPIDKETESTGLLNILSLVKKATNRCIPQESIPNVYKMKSNIYLQELTKQIEKYNSNSPKKTYNITRIVMNFNGKAIGVEVKENGKGDGKFIPCFGSSLPYGIIQPDPELIITMDDISPQSYADTFNWLSLIDINIPGLECKPTFKVINEGFIVGIITSADQFIPTQPIIETEFEMLIDEKLDLPTHTAYIKNSHNLERSLGLSSNIDTKRETIINNIRLDSYYYNVFRAVVKKLINSYEYLEIRKDILDYLQESTDNIRDKRTFVIEKLNEILSDNIQFVDQPNQTKQQVLSMVQCINKQEESCDLGVCGFINERCVPLFPIMSLTTGKDNRKVYLLRLADEIIRYKRIKKYLFDKKKYLALEDTRLTLGENEMLMYESELTQEYLRDITSKAIDENNFKKVPDTTNPKQLGIPIETTYTKQEL